MTAQESDNSTAILSRMARTAKTLVVLKNVFCKIRGHFTGRPNHAVFFKVLQLLLLIVDESFNLVTWS